MLYADFSRGVEHRVGQDVQRVAVIQPTNDERLHQSSKVVTSDSKLANKRKVLSPLRNISRHTHS